MSSAPMISESLIFRVAFNLLAGNFFFFVHLIISRLQNSKTRRTSTKSNFSACRVEPDYFFIPREQFV